MSEQTTTNGPAASKKNVRVPVTAGRKALEKHVSKDSQARDNPRIDAQARHAMIAQAAYFRAERRGFTDGGALNDWLEAEREITRMLES